jgi:hypothetical protein
LKIDSNEKATGRNYWIWITRPDYYLDDDGTDPEYLNPKSKYASDGEWTCSKYTKKGDLAFS